MDLQIDDVADLLNVSETKVHDWLEDGKIPAYRINGEYRFSRIEIEDWVMSHKLDQSSFKEKGLDSELPKGGTKQYSLYRAIHRGGVIHGIPGTTKEEIIRRTTKIMAADMSLDADVLSDLLLDREKLQPTSLNNGLAVPHTRDFLLNEHFDVVTIAFPEEPIAYGALDGNPVELLFFLFASDDKRHLHLLAKIAHLSSQEQSLAFLKTKPNKAKLLEYIKEWEGNLAVN